VDRTVILLTSRLSTVATDVRKAIYSFAAAKKTLLKTAVKMILKPITRKMMTFV
jgi:hypothetical protein